MPLNTNLLRAPAGIELPDQLARMATVEQIRSAQMNQETARINQQIHNESLAKTRRAQQYLEQLVPKLTSLGAPDQLEAQVLALLNAPDENLQKHGADMLKVWQQASREKRWSDRFGTPPEPTVATGAIQSPEVKVSPLETGPSGVAPQTFNAPAGVAGVVVGREQPPPMRLNNLPGASEGLAQNRLKMIQDAKAEVSFAAREAASNPSALPFLTAAQNRLQELLNSPIGEAGKTYMVNGKPVQMPLAPIESQREYLATQEDPGYGAYLQGKVAATTRPITLSPNERAVNPNTGKEIARGLPPVVTPEKPITELQRINLQKSAAADKSSIDNAKTTTNELQKLADDLLGNPEKGTAPHPGLSRITGLMSKIPNAPESNAAQAQQKLETFKGKIKTFGRQLASQEGKLGNMAVQEWKFISDSVESIDPYAGNLDEQLRNAVRQARDFASRLQEKYDLSYEGVNVSPRSATKPSAPAATKPATAASKAPAGVPQDVWSVMTPDERKLWQK
jgi:hypothetical protein